MSGVNASGSLVISLKDNRTQNYFPGGESRISERTILIEAYFYSPSVFTGHYGLTICQVKKHGTRIRAKLVGCL